MSGVAFALGVSAFLLGFIDPGFYPLAWISLAGGVLLAVLLWAKHRRSSHPTVSHLAPEPEENKAIHPK
jgi:hypothetical protein